MKAWVKVIPAVLFLHRPSDGTSRPPRASQLSPSLHLLLDRVPVRVPLVTREKRNVVLRPLCIVCMSKHSLNDPKIPRSPRSQVSSFNLLWAHLLPSVFYINLNKQERIAFGLFFLRRSFHKGLSEISDLDWQKFIIYINNVSSVSDCATHRTALILSELE